MVDLSRQAPEILNAKRPNNITDRSLDNVSIEESSNEQDAVKNGSNISKLFI